MRARQRANEGGAGANEDGGIKLKRAGQRANEGEAES